MTVKRFWIICLAIILIFIVSSCGKTEPQTQTTTNALAETTEYAETSQTETSRTSYPEDTAEVITPETTELTETTTSLTESAAEEPVASYAVNTAELIGNIKKAYEGAELYVYSIDTDGYTKANNLTMLDALFDGLSDYRFEIFNEVPEISYDTVTIDFGPTSPCNYVRFYNVENGILEFNDGSGKITFYSVTGVPYSGNDLYEWFIKNYYWVEAKRMNTVFAETPENAVHEFVTKDLFYRELYVSPENPQKIVNYSVLNYKIVEISEDRTSVTVALTYRVKPSDITKYMYAGSVHRLYGEWDGWLENEAIYKLIFNSNYGSWEYEQIWN